MRVELAGADPGPDGGPHRLQRAGRDEPGGAHELDLVRRLDLDHASTPLREQREPGQQPCPITCTAHALSPCSAARGRRRPSAPSARGRDLLDLTDRVDAGEQALGLVEARQRRGLFPVDLAGGAGRSRACRRRAAPTRRRPACAGRTAGGPAPPRRRRARARGRAPAPARPASRAAARPGRSCAGSRRAGTRPWRPARPAGPCTIATVISSGTRSPASM